MAKPTKKAKSKQPPKRPRAWIQATEVRKTFAVKAAQPKLITLEVRIFGGPVTEEFCQANPVCARVIAIRSNQTLDKLHWAIFSAFDRDEEHLYEFQFGKKPMDPKGEKYGIIMAHSFAMPGEPEIGDALETTLHSLDLTVGREFFYWFDFGDDWWHAIKVLQIDEIIPPGKYPQVTQRIGASPPQYPGQDEDYDDEEVDDEEVDDEGEEEQADEDAEDQAPDERASDDPKSHGP